MKSINIITEDRLGEELARKIIHEVGGFNILLSDHLGGERNVIRNLEKYNKASKNNSPFFILIDLDHEVCPITKIQKTITFEKDPRFIYRIAVREAESWLMADRENFANLFNKTSSIIPYNADEIKHPKEFLLNIIEKHASRHLKNDMLPSKKSTAKIGPEYNSILCNFIFYTWNIRNAMDHSESLKKTVLALEKLKAL